MAKKNKLIATWKEYFKRENFTGFGYETAYQQKNIKIELIS